MKLFTEQIPDDDVFQSLTAATEADYDNRTESTAEDEPFSQSLQVIGSEQNKERGTKALAEESARPDPEQGLLHAKKTSYRHAPDHSAKASGF